MTQNMNDGPDRLATVAPPVGTSYSELIIFSD